MFSEWRKEGKNKNSSYIHIYTPSRCPIQHSKVKKQITRYCLHLEMESQWFFLEIPFNFWIFVIFLLVCLNNEEYFLASS